MDDDKLMMGMRLARALSALVEVSAVVLLFRMNSVGAMLRLNGMLGLVGPLIFITVSALGLADSVGKLPFSRLGLVLLGVCLILWGTRQ